MAFTLTIDEGNSSTKMALWDGDHIAATSVGAEIPSSWAPEATIVSSVRPDSKWPRGCSASYIRLDSSTPLPIDIHYQSRSSLGSDRIAAAAGAHRLSPGRASLIVDAGTAVTYDLIDPEGTFEGGNIAPGIELRLGALHRFTAALPKVNAEGDTPLLGYSTQTAMRAGAVRGICAELEFYRNRLADRFGHIDTYLTGGDAEKISEFITQPYKIEPALVMIGLKYILDYNENK